MKIAELSARSGMANSTIKLYMRNGMLPRGARTAANQATYTSDHLRRLSLIRALREVGGLSMNQTQRVVAAIDERSIDPLRLTAAVLDATARPAPAAVGTQNEREAAYRDVDAFLAKRRWPVREGSSARREVADALVALRIFVEPGLSAEAFGPYARAAEEMAAVEFRSLRHQRGSADEAIEAAVTGTILWERVFVALRRIAHERLATRRRRTNTEPAKRTPRPRP